MFIRQQYQVLHPIPTKLGKTELPLAHLSCPKSVWQWKMPHLPKNSHQMYTPEIPKIATFSEKLPFSTHVPSSISGMYMAQIQFKARMAFWLCRDGFFPVKNPGHMPSSTKSNDSVDTTATVKVLAVTTPLTERDTSWWLNHPKT